jgi:hypothetical protein
MPRYVILDHDHPFPHWDFMIEAGDRLRTWRLHAAPTPGRIVRAEPLGDHRTAYLDYEGPVSDDRGRVIRWDAGTFAIVAESADELRLVLTGAVLIGTAALSRAEGEWLWEFAGRYASGGPVG